VLTGGQLWWALPCSLTVHGALIFLVVTSP